MDSNTSSIFQIYADFNFANLTFKFAQSTFSNKSKYVLAVEHVDFLKKIKWIALLTKWEHYYTQIKQ